jgi:hypothetical protein
VRLGCQASDSFDTLATQSASGASAPSSTYPVSYPLIQQRPQRLEVDEEDFQQQHEQQQQQHFSQTEEEVNDAQHTAEENDDGKHSPAPPEKTYSAVAKSKPWQLKRFPSNESSKPPDDIIFTSAAAAAASTSAAAASTFASTATLSPQRPQGRAEERTPESPKSNKYKNHSPKQRARLQRVSLDSVDNSSIPVPFNNGLVYDNVTSIHVRNGKEIRIQTNNL